MRTWRQQSGKKISIHAPTKGATFLKTLMPIVTANFNPRSHEGSDPKCTQITPRFIHFNPRSHEGSDSRRVAILTTFSRFQSTLPRRERLPVSHCAGQIFIISIHAPTKGATVERAGIIRLTMISIHAPTKGATAILYNKFLLFHIILTNPSKDT